jgi:hypothetical protein
MDAKFFLKRRASFIRFFYDTSAAAFRSVQTKIEAKEAPFDNPPYSEDPEPAYLEEWMEAETGVDILSQSCVALLSDSLKLYFNTMRERVIGFKFGEDQAAIQRGQGFVAANKTALGEILDTDWTDCPVRFDIIEQVVLARNRAQHGNHLSSLLVQHDKKTLQKHPEPFFANEDELSLWKEAGGDPDAVFTAPSLKITRENLFSAVVEIEHLADWIEGRLEKAWEWRRALTIQ